MRRSKNGLVFIFITVLIDCIGIRIIYPVIASIIAEVSNVSINKAVIYSGWMMASYALMQFIFSPILGRLSDRYGRRPVLLLSLLGLGIDYLFLALATTLPLLFVGRIIAGICGASFTTSFAYVADISKPQDRAQNFGFIGAAIGLGFIVGPFIGGVLSEYGTRIPFIAAACLSLLNLLYGFFILPESLKPENRRAFSIKPINLFAPFISIKRNKPLFMLISLLFIVFVAGQAMPSIWPFYTKYLYKWSDLQIGYSLAYVGTLIAIVKTGLIKWGQKKLGPIRIIYVGLFFYVIGLTLFAFATEPWMIYLFAPIYCLGGIASPSIQGIISSQMMANEQGELQGVITSLLSLANIVSPIIMTDLFYFFTKTDAIIHFPGVPFIAAALIILTGFLMVWKKLKVQIT
jgi:DHA1 family tetracycline resistance protein-like MFS transporter